eukprot:2165761-Pleurochrysis_carterae.AAC.4
MLTLIRAQARLSFRHPGQQVLSLHPLARPPHPRSLLLPKPPRARRPRPPTPSLRSSSTSAMRRSASGSTSRTSTLSTASSPQGRCAPLRTCCCDPPSTSSSRTERAHTQPCLRVRTRASAQFSSSRVHVL